MPLTHSAIDAKLLWCVCVNPDQAIEWTVEWPVKWHPVTLAQIYPDVLIYIDPYI